jgi:hypothetical protein
VALLVAASASVATADPGEDAYQRGRSHYDLREWDQAIAEFKEAYRLRSDAASLFNIAQSYRLKGDCAEAASFYKTYRRNFPSEKNIARVDQFITEMEACAKQAPATTGQPAGTPTSDPATSTGTGTATGATSSGAPPTRGTTGTTRTAMTTAPTSPTSGGDTPREHGMPRGYLIGALAATGVGLAAIGGGAWAGNRARDIAADVEQLPTWDPDLHARGQRMDLTAKLLFVGGGAALVTGGVLLYLGLRSRDDGSTSTAVHVVPRGDGATIVWTGSL